LAGDIPFHNATLPHPQMADIYVFLQDFMQHMLRNHLG